VRLLFHVQHLLGIGHVRRAAAIARALAETGFAVTVAQGGFPVSGIDWGAAAVVDLPPARSLDSGFKTLVGADGGPLDDVWKKRRAAMLLALHATLRPEVLLVETFPFGRRAFRFELTPMLEMARRARPPRLIACSVRDILVEKGDRARLAEMAAAARRWFDCVLVHGDPALVPFEASFPPAGEIADLLHYTGYVAQPSSVPAPPGEGEDEILVSVGGGAVGETLLRTALAARAMSRHAGARWRLLAGPDLPDAAVAALRDASDDGAVIERARPDFPALLSRCRLSVSQAGYNTVLDVLAAGCRALFVPFAAPGETEQTRRAELLAARGHCHLLPERGLAATALAAAIDRAADAPLPPRLALATDGARRTAALLRAMADRSAA
jgi:predicted glycosyltransferase